MSTPNLAEYRSSPTEQKRIASLVSLLDGVSGSVLDIGARDGYISVRLAECFERVTALDLELPTINHPRITCVKGNILALDFPTGAFDAVICAEVLEHIDPAQLPKACTELARVAKKVALIGVPFEQDIRVGRLTCLSCGKINPPWGHVNQFSESRLKSLFSTMTAAKVDFIGTTTERTNFASALLNDLAGNPYGDYNQEEPCVYCGAKLVAPGPRNVPQRLLTRAAVTLNRLQRPFISPRPNWIHIRFARNDG